MNSGPDWAGDTGFHACGEFSPDPNPQESRSHRAAGTRRRDLPPLRRLTALPVGIQPISALWKLGTSLRLIPVLSKPVPCGGQPPRLLPSTNPDAAPRPRLPASILGGTLRAAASAKGSSGLCHRRQRHRHGPLPGWDWPSSSASPAQRLPSLRLSSPGMAADAGLGPEAAWPGWAVLQPEPEGCISPPGRRAGWGGVYLRDAGGEGGTGNRLTCKWDFWEVECWRAFSLELS